MYLILETVFASEKMKFYEIRFPNLLSYNFYSGIFHFERSIT